MLFIISITEGDEIQNTGRMSDGFAILRAIGLFTFLRVLVDVRCDKVGLFA